MTKKERAIKALYKEYSNKITEQTQEIHRLVKGSGDLDSKVVFIAHFPTAMEEEEGEAFYGDLGKAFSDILESVGMSMADVYVTHLVKYEPYKMKGNRVYKRKPNEEEHELFFGQLTKELDIIKPDYVVTFGEDLLKVLMNDAHIELDETKGKLLSVNFGLKKYKLIPMHHPMEKNQSIQQDLEVIRTIWDYIDGNEAKRSEVKKPTYKILPKKQVMTEEEKSEGESKTNYRTKVIMVNGTTGFSDDPTIEVLNKISYVLTELETNIVKLDLNKPYDIHEFLKELMTADGVILATTVNWIGIGGKLQTFLDDCYRYGRQEMFEDIYSMCVVISKQMNERDAYHHLIRSFEMLGGMEGESICASIKNVVEFETNKQLTDTVDKKAENFYRIIHRKPAPLPSSIRLNKTVHQVEETITVQSGDVPVEKQKSALIANYDEFIEKQKEDIEALSFFYKKKTGAVAAENNGEIDKFITSYKGSDLNNSIQWLVDDDEGKDFYMTFNNGKLICDKGRVNNHQVQVHLNYDILRKISTGKLTIQRSFMTGLLKVQGDFSVMYQLDQLFDL